jgi:hypothetical protein
VEAPRPQSPNREAPSRLAPPWVEVGPRAAVHQILASLLRITPDAAIRIEVKEGQHFLKLDSEQNADIAALLAKHRRLSEKPGGNEVPLLAFALDVRPLAAPTPAATALLASGEALSTLARVADPKTLSVRSFGRGGATYALIERIAALPNSLFRRPDITRLWSAAPGVFSECGFDPALPTAAISRWLPAGHVVVFRRRGGNLHASGASALGEGATWLTILPPPISNARSPAGFVPLRFVHGRTEADRPSGMFAEGSALGSLKRWVRRAAAPLLDGLTLYADRKFWLVIGDTSAFFPPFGTCLRNLESGGRRALLPMGLTLAPRLSASAILDAVGARSQEIVLVRPDTDGQPIPTRILNTLLCPLDRRLAKESP